MIDKAVPQKYYSYSKDLLDGISRVQCTSLKVIFYIKIPDLIVLIRTNQGNEVIRFWMKIMSVQVHSYNYF